MHRLLVPFFSVFLSTACVAQVTAPQAPVGMAAISVDSLMAHVGFLASRELGGRAAGSPEIEVARQYLVNLFDEVGLSPVGADWLHEFDFDSEAGAPTVGANVVGMIRGTEEPDRYVVVTAHYDHLGRQGNLVYHGADDNASGTAAIVEMARFLSENPPRHSILFAALDAEEHGLVGARALVSDPPVPLDSIVLNINLDMVSRSSAGELYVAGTHPYPELLPIVQEVARDAPVRLLTGHDRPDGSAGDDWTHLSDQGAFHAAGIPFLYFGVEDHPDYHRPTDTADRIEPEFFRRAVVTVLRTVQVADETLDGGR